MTTRNLPILTLPVGISEGDFQRIVIRIAKLRGWRVAHFRTSLNKSGRWSTAVSADGAGFPDLVLAKTGHETLFRELKTDKGRLSDEQRTWGEVLGDAWAVWRPRDIEQIERELRS